MELNDRYHCVFGKVPIFGMIHLAGDEPVLRALEELALFEQEGVDGAIIENYHGSKQDVEDTLREIFHMNVKIGINILPNEFDDSLAMAKRYGADFVQLDNIAGTYTNGILDYSRYAVIKDKFPEIIVLGGVWPKYYDPVEGSNLEQDIKIGMQRCEAIVVTGAGTGMQTSLEKIKTFREVTGDHPLIIGAGLNCDNAYEQLMLADGAIVGSCFKPGGDTNCKIDAYMVRDFMDVVREVRNNL